MNEKLQRWLNYCIELYLKNEEQQIVFPSILILILRFQQAFQILSYIYGQNAHSYLTLIMMFARPQIYLPGTDIAQYVILIICLLYLLNIASLISGLKYIKIYGQLLRCGLLNFFFEYSTGTIQTFTHSLLLLISITETFILQGTLNAQTINFQHTRFTILDLIIQTLNYTIMIFYSYELSNQSIIFLAFSINLLRAINQLYFSPLKNLITKCMLLTIYIYNIYQGFLWMFSLQKNFISELVLIPLIYNVIYITYLKIFKLSILLKKNKTCDMISILVFLDNIKDLKDFKIEKPNNPKDKIIFCSLLMLQGQNYEAFRELIAIHDQDLNILERFKKKVIKKQCINKIDINIQIQSDMQHRLTLTVAALITSEQQNSIIYDQIILILKEKIRILQLLAQNQSYNHYSQYFNFTKQLLDLKRRLEQQYKNYACAKTQCILGFFYVLVLNDYLAANSLFSVMSISEEKIKRINMNQDVFSNKMIFIITTFKENLIIKKLSSDAPKFFDKSIEFLQGKSANILIPPGISEYHDQFILEFLQTGQAKYMRVINSNYYYCSEQNYMTNIEFAFDVNLQNDFSFISFIQPIINQPMSLIINNDHIITCISEGLIEYLEFKFQISKHLGNKIQQILPEFQIPNQNYQVIENAEAIFLKFEENTFISQQMQESYITTYSIYYKKLKDHVIYYIITFEYFKKNLGQTSMVNSRMSPINSFRKEEVIQSSFNLINQESFVKIPYNEYNSQQKIQNQLNGLNIFKIQVEEGSEIPIINNELKLISQSENLNLISPNSKVEMLVSEQGRTSKQKFKKQNVRISIAEEQQSSQERIVAYQDDRSSQVSSLLGVRKSKFYRKYEIVQKVTNLESFSKNHQILICLLVFCILIQIAVQSLQLVEININLSNLVSDIDLLQIKYFVFQPLETFLLTRYTIVSYSQQRDSKAIPITQFNELVKFPRSNLVLGYDSLDQNLKQVMNRPELQDFLENTYLDIYIYIKSAVGEKYNMSLRNSISILKNYQYISKMAYVIDGVAQADSPYSYYQYKNYLPLKTLFSELNQIVQEQTIQRSQNLQRQILINLLICNTLLILFQIQIFIFYIRITKRLNRHFQLLYNISGQYIDQELIRMKNLVEKLFKDQNILFKYQFNLSDNEKILEQYNEKIQAVRRNNQKINLINCNEIYYYFFMFLIMLIMAGNSLLTFLEGFDYLDKYPETAKFYRAVSDVGTDIPTMYAQRDILYGRTNIKLYTEEDCQDLLNEIKNALNRTSSFIDRSAQFDKYLVSSTFEHYYQSLQINDLCNFIPENLKQKSITLCPFVMNQNMKMGLKAVLVYIINFITTEMEINAFKNRTTQNNLELEGAFLVSNIIGSINMYFNQDLIEQTQKIIAKINLHNIFILSVLCLIIIFILTIFKQKLISKSYIVQRFVYLLPVYHLFLDSVFERTLRQLVQYN
ncbi:unnamed protein product [Paramecium sonneborni]|uniref:Transmembrane protein n=1 Tax=Paramecium sonneborni TaxID=65129 RepID=A0A8S1PRZ9_9CILI|nr:unnamed protein product [Paramecium sonneborni]